MSIVASPVASRARLKASCLRLSSLLMDTRLREIAAPSKLVMVPARCGKRKRSLSKAPAKPPPL